MIEYAPAPESRSVVKLKKSYGLFIDGDFVQPIEGGAYTTINPATEEALASVPEGTDADVDAMVTRGRRNGVLEVEFRTGAMIHSIVEYLVEITRYITLKNLGGSTLTARVVDPHGSATFSVSGSVGGNSTGVLTVVARTAKGSTVGIP